jgi:cardiolipin synthase
VPLVAYALVERAYGVALALFLLAAVSDGVDGFIARRFALTSRLGAALDPVADKLVMLVATLALAWEELLPMWLAVAIVARDAVIVAGALAYRATFGRIRIAPTRLSKINTAIEFALLALVMAGAAESVGVSVSGWIGVAFVVAGVTVIASGLQYVLLWGRKALRQRRK